MRDFFTAGLRSPARLAVPFFVAMAVASCGGGGGGGSSGSSTNCLPYSTDVNCSTSGTGGTTTSVAAITLSLVDAGSGLSSNNLTSGKPLTVKATLLSASGAALGNKVVTFTTNSTLAVFDPASGTRLTGTDGTTSVTLIAADLAASGAAEVTASVDVDGTAITKKIAYSVSPGSITLSSLAATTPRLSAYGSTSISVQVLLNGVLTTTPQTVNFSSGCDSNAKASITKSVATVNGVATATYTDQGCAGTDVITVSAQGTSAQTSITVDAPQASNISYVSASPSSIVLAGTGGGGLSSDSVVTFKVVDSTNNPVASRAVSFDLSTRVGGIKLNNQLNGVVQATSDALGLVSVTVSAGSVPTPVWVTASLVSDASIKSQSTNLTISTGRPTQDRFSVAVKTFNPEGWRKDGTTTAVTVYAFDRLGNPVPNGTVVNFISEGAGIEPSCQTTSGSCSVNFTSAELRPRVDTEPSSSVTAGRVTVLAYAQGEESFDDLNTNNLYDLNEPFRDLGDAFVDNNENRSWSAGEREIEFSSTNTTSCAAYPADGRYYNAPYKSSTCDGVWGQAHVRRTAVVVLSSYVIGTISPSVFTMPALPLCTGSFTFRLSDENNNPMPAGATLSAVSGVTYVNDTNETVKASVTFVPGSQSVPNTSAAGGTYHSFTVEGTKCTTRPVGTVGVTVTSPSGDASVRSITIN